MGQGQCVSERVVSPGVEDDIDMRKRIPPPFPELASVVSSAVEMEVEPRRLLLTPPMPELKRLDESVPPQVAAQAPRTPPRQQVESPTRSSRSSGPAGQFVGALFDAIDVDGSGFMEAAEGKRFLNVAGCVDDELEYYWQNILRTADANHDGKISKDEFMVYILGGTELDWKGQFSDDSRHDELAAALRALGSSSGLPLEPVSPRAQPPQPSPAVAAEARSTSPVPRTGEMPPMPAPLGLAEATQVTLLVMENELINTKQKLELTVADFEELLSQVQSQLKLSVAIEVVKLGSDSAATSFGEFPKQKGGGRKAKIEVRAARSSAPVAATGAAQMHIVQHALLPPVLRTQPEPESEPEAEAEGAVAVDERILQEQWLEVDVNRIGTLTKDDTATVLANCGLTVKSDADLEDAMTGFDGYSNQGTIDFGELTEWIDENATTGMLTQTQTPMPTASSSFRPLASASPQANGGGGRHPLAVAAAARQSAAAPAAAQPAGEESPDSVAEMGSPRRSSEEQSDYLSAAEPESDGSFDLSPRVRSPTSSHQVVKVASPYAPHRASPTFYDTSEQQPVVRRDLQTVSSSSTRLIEQLRRDRERRAEASARAVLVHAMRKEEEAEQQEEDRVVRFQQLRGSFVPYTPHPMYTTYSREMDTDPSRSGLSLSPQVPTPQQVRQSGGLVAQATLQMQDEARSPTRTDYSGAAGSPNSSSPMISLGSPGVDIVHDLAKQLSMTERAELAKRLGGKAAEEGTPPELMHSPARMQQAWLEVDTDRKGVLECDLVATVLRRLGAALADAVELDDAVTGYDAQSGQGTMDFDEFVAWYRGGVSSGKITLASAKQQLGAVPRRIFQGDAKQASPGVTMWAEAESTHREVRAASSSNTRLIEQLRRDRERRQQMMVDSSSPSRR